MVRPAVRDDGFSMIEVLFSAFIAFFVLTAIFGVLVTSSTQGRIASADTVATNLAQLVVEQARSLPYDSVGTTNAPSGQPVGVLPSLETTVFQNLRFEIERQVVWFDDPSNNTQPGNNTADYKQLTVAVRWVGGHATPMITYIRDHSNESPPLPSVRWLVQPLRPSTQTWAYPVLFSGTGSSSEMHKTYVWDGLTTTGHLSSLASIQASASIDATGALITRMEFWCGQFSMTAPWTGAETPHTYPEDHEGAFLLDLYSTDTSGNALFKEGQNTIKVVATTNMLSYQTAFLQVTVDNTAAAFPATATASLGVSPGNKDRYDSKMVLAWTPPEDGPNQPATRYDLTLQKAGTASGTTYSFLELGGTGKLVIGNGFSGTWEMLPFTAYRATLRPRSIRGLTSSTAVTSPYAVSSPRLRATVFNQATNKKAPNSFRFDLNIDPAPQANLAALLGGTSIKYDVYSMDGAGYTYPATGDLPTSARLELVDQTTIPIAVSTGTSCQKYFQVEAKIMSGTTVVHRVRSNVVGALGATAGPPWQQTKVVPDPW